MSRRRETSQKIPLMFVVYWVLLLTASVSSSTGTSLVFKEGAPGHAEGTLSKYSLTNSILRRAQKVTKYLKQYIERFPK